jgi:hypothetical protein
MMGSRLESSRRGAAAAASPALGACAGRAGGAAAARVAVPWGAWTQTDPLPASPEPGGRRSGELSESARQPEPAALELVQPWQLR